MANRVSGRFAPAPPPHVDLPTLRHPQIVDADGFELTDEQLVGLASGVLRASTTEPTAADETAEEEQNDAEEKDDPEQTEAMEVDDDAVQDPVAVEEVQMAEGTEPQQPSKQPLLNLAESMILQYSLIQTRYHHLNHLLPHVFSHPAVPAHSRPRARPPPKGTFLYPTPKPVVPLPAREYHAPLKKDKGKKDEDLDKRGDKGKADAEHAAECKEGENKDEVAAKKKGGRRKPRASEGTPAPPHEIECIARVTLQVGPISFPNTELWVGQFVQEREGAGGTVRMRPPKAPKEPREKPPREKRPSETQPRKKEPKRPRVSATVPARQTPRPPAPTPTPAPAAARPPTQTPGAGPSTGPIPGAGVRYASRADIPQTLIQRVNAAASQHPWLSILIHKAARNVANKDELAKLGRVVGRLGRGEGVGEGPEMPGLPGGPTMAGLLPRPGAPGTRPAAARPGAAPSTTAARPTATAGVRPPVGVAASVRPGVPAVRPPATGTAVRPPGSGAPGARPPVVRTPSVRPPTTSAAAARPPIAAATPVSVQNTTPGAQAARPPAAQASSSTTDGSRPPAVVPSVQPATAAAPATASKPVSTPAPAPPTEETQYTPAESDLSDLSDSDSDADLTGPPQSGGGPVPPASDPSEAASEQAVSDTPATESSASAAPAPSGSTLAPAATGSEEAKPVVAVVSSATGIPAGTAPPGSAATPTVVPQPATPPPAATAGASAVQALPSNASQPQHQGTSQASGAATSSVASGSAQMVTPAAPVQSLATPVASAVPALSSVSAAPPAAPNAPTPASVPASTPALTAPVSGVRTVPTIPATPTPAGRLPNVSYYLPGQSTPQPGPARTGGSPSVSTTAPALSRQPTYPLPPRFLLVAFREAPTEKFVIPLGPHSYVSRVGGDFVTSPPPKAPEPPPPSPIKIKVEDVPAEAQQPKEVEAPVKKRTRASTAKAPTPKPASPEPEPVKEPTPPPPKSNPYEDLPVVPGMQPDKGTVLVSTYMPLNGWQKPDWQKLQKRLPFDNPKFVERLRAPSADMEASPKKSPQSPKRDLRPAQKPPKAEPTTREGMLNLAAENYMPPDGHVEPITIRIVGLDDQKWKRFKGVMDEVEKCELETLAWVGPELNKNVPKEPTLPAGVAHEAPRQSTGPTAPEASEKSESVPVAQIEAPASAAVSTTTADAAVAPTSTPAHPPQPEPVAAPALGPAQATANAQPTQPPASLTPVAATIPTPAAVSAAATPAPMTPRPAPASTSDAVKAKPLAPEVRDTWLSRKRERFTSLLARVGERVFPRFRVEATIPLITEATADKWALRPYHMTTRPLYTREHDEAEDDEDVVPQSPEQRRRRREPEPTVTFEMPVSLDALDERVEAGAAVSLSRRGRGRGAAPVRKFRRGTAGAICEGCGLPGLKVWRRGPNGRGTLCNACGDKFLAGTLGELKAPGAASQKDDEEKEGTEGRDDEVKREPGQDGGESKDVEAPEKTYAAPEGGEGNLAPKDLSPAVVAPESQEEAAIDADLVTDRKVASNGDEKVDEVSVATPDGATPAALTSEDAAAPASAASAEVAAPTASASTASAPAEPPAANTPGEPAEAAAAEETAAAEEMDVDA